MLYNNNIIKSKPLVSGKLYNGRAVNVIITMEVQIGRGWTRAGDIVRRGGVRGRAGVGRGGEEGLGGVLSATGIDREEANGDIAGVHVHHGLLSTYLPEVQAQLGFVQGIQQQCVHSLCTDQGPVALPSVWVLWIPVSFTPLFKSSE